MAGIAQNRPPAILDADTVSPEEREELARLVRDALAARKQPDDAARRAPGSYTITIDDGARQETLSVADMDEEHEPAAFALRSWIQARLASAGD